MSESSRIATKIPQDLADHIAHNAGVIVSDFSTTDWSVDVSNIIGATTGGIAFSDTPEYSDMGEDVDNCPKNVKEMKRLESRDVKISGTFVTITPELAKTLIAAADLDTSNKTVTPRGDLEDADFKDLWFITDYGKDNAIALEMKNLLSTSGLSIQTTDKGKGTFAFEFTAHYSAQNPDEEPYKFHYKK